MSEKVEERESIFLFFYRIAALCKKKNKKIGVISTVFAAS